MFVKNKSYRAIALMLMCVSLVAPIQAGIFSTAWNETKTHARLAMGSGKVGLLIYGIGTVIKEKNIKTLPEACLFAGGVLFLGYSAKHDFQEAMKEGECSHCQNQKARK